MAGKPFDASTKELIRSHPMDWLNYLGLPAHSVTIVDADLSTVSPDADKILIVDADRPYIAHLELQSQYAADDAERFMEYNILAGRKHALRVRTVVFLLRPEADGPVMREPLVRQFEDEEAYLYFKFRVVRVWEQPVEAILAGGIGMLPLAPLCRVTPGELPDVIRQMEHRIDQSAHAEAGAFWTSVYILMGLRYSGQFAAQLLKGVRAMKESTTYQAILEEGEAIGEARGEAIGEARGEAIGEARGLVEGERRILLLLGEKRFGEPDREAQKAIQAIATVEQLERLTTKLLEVETWAELLELTSPRP